MTDVAISGASPGRSKAGILLAASLTSSLIMLDSNVVAVSLPAIGRSFGASFASLQWVISAYVLTYAALLLAAGSYADLRGRRHAMLLGLVIFAVASVFCGLAASAMALNLARAAQGVGGALLLTASLAVISHAFAGVERSEAFAFWGASLGIALAVGPIVGGAVTNWVGWRWIFLANVPLCIALIAAAYLVIEESKDPAARTLDLPGTITFSAGLALLIWALNEGNDAGWSSPPILGRIALSAALFVAFYVAEVRQTRAMVDVSLFSRRTFVGATMAMLGYGASAQVMVFFLPLYLQNAYGFAPFLAGLAMMPFALPMVFAPKYTTRLAQHLSGRDLLAGGLLVTMLGDVAFCLAARSDLSYPAFAGAMLVAGTGAGLLNGQTVKVMQGVAPADRAGMASGLASTTRFIGILVSVALLGAALAGGIKGATATSAQRFGLGSLVPPDAAAAIASGDVARLLRSTPADLHEAVLRWAHHVYGVGFAAVATSAAVVALLTALLTALLVRPEETAARPLPHKPPCKTIDCRDPL